MYIISEIHKSSAWYVDRKKIIGTQVFKNQLSKPGVKIRGCWYFYTGSIPINDTENASSIAWVKIKKVIKRKETK